MILYIFLLLEIEILDFQIQDFGIASLSCIISLYCASISAPCAPRAKLLVAICCSCSYTSPLLSARPGHGTGSPRIVRNRHSCSFPPGQPGVHWSHREEWMPSQTQTKSTSGESRFGSSRSMRLAMDHLVTVSMKGIPFLAKAAFLVARSVLAITVTGGTPCCHPCSVLYLPVDRTKKDPA